MSAQTVRAYVSDLRAWLVWTRRTQVNPFFVTHRDLRRYLADMTQARYTPRTIGRHLSALRGMYRWLAREDICDAGAVEAVASPRLAHTLPKVMSDDDAVALIATCNAGTAEGMRDRAFLELLYASGARICELSRLNVGDVDLHERQLRLFGKGSKERIVPIYPMAVSAVSEYLGGARGELLAKARQPSDDATRAVFVSTRGNRMSTGGLRSRFELAVRHAGVDATLTPHAMRHTYATELLAGGADMRSVQELLGHASLSTTQVYTHLSVDRLKAAARQAHPRSE